MGIYCFVFGTNIDIYGNPFQELMEIKSRLISYEGTWDLQWNDDVRGQAAQTGCQHSTCLLKRDAKGKRARQKTESCQIHSRGKVSEWRRQVLMHWLVCWATIKDWAKDRCMINKSLKNIDTTWVLYYSIHITTAPIWVLDGDMTSRVSVPQL